MTVKTVSVLGCWDQSTTNYKEKTAGCWIWAIIMDSNAQAVKYTTNMVGNANTRFQERVFGYLICLQDEILKRENWGVGEDDVDN